MGSVHYIQKVSQNNRHFKLFNHRMYQYNMQGDKINVLNCDANIPLFNGHHFCDRIEIYLS